MALTILRRVAIPYVDEDTGEECPQWEVEINGERFYCTQNEIDDMLNAMTVSTFTE